MPLSIPLKKKIDAFVGYPMILGLKGAALLLGLFLRRNHSAIPRTSIYWMKLMGGGSLLISAPAIIGLKRARPDLNFGFAGTQTTRSFAELLNVFDSIAIVDDRSLLRLVLSALKTLTCLFRTDTIVDLEVYSCLSSVFSLLTCARNRVGFYTESSFWRSGIATHLLFFNRSSGTHVFYDQVCELLGARPATLAECRAQIGVERRPPEDNTYRIGVGHGCSDLSRERMLTTQQWASVLRRACADAGGKPVEIWFFGNRNEANAADKIMHALRADGLMKAEFVNMCGAYSLKESLENVGRMSIFFAIDSALLHMSRLLEVPSVSFWGPTDPKTLLRPIEGLKESISYAKLSCSPCVHLADIPPCRGQNLCISALFDEHKSQSTPWLMET